jgi:hypothetical protein
VARASTAVARPLKTLVPLIQQELTEADRAGLEHYRKAGEMLLEAREQVAAFKWGAWLSKNFALSRMTASRYMRLATLVEAGGRIGADTTLESALGERPRKDRHAVWGKVRDIAAKVDADDLGQARQVREEEIRIHRELALELIDIGYKALATRLHPDRGGSKDAMRRLNRVRDELKGVAETRRFE